MKAHKNGDDNFNKDFEHRITKLESDNDSIKNSLLRIENKLSDMDKKIDSNFKWSIGLMFGGFVIMVSGFAGTLTVMAHGFKWL